MRETSLPYKGGVCNAVINKLKKNGIKPQRREYLESIKDLDKAYIVANRYLRNYIEFKDNNERKEFFKEVKRIALKCDIRVGRWLYKEEPIISEEVDKDIQSNSIVNESNETFIRNIEHADKSIKSNAESKSVEIIDENKGYVDGKSLFSMAVENGVNRFSKKFLDSIGVEKELVGFRDEVEVYYCKGVNGIFEIV